MSQDSSQNQLFVKKTLEQVLKEQEGGHRLKRVLGPIALTALGIGAVIGAGIFVATGKAANEVAGPALMVSYAYAGLACIFAALCYAEFASMAPVAGSAYTYAYTTLGELFAWIIGWDLVLEYAVGAATVASGWSSYFQKLLGAVGISVPLLLSGGPYKYDDGKLLPNMVASYDAGDKELHQAAHKFVPKAKDLDDDTKKKLNLTGNETDLLCWKDLKTGKLLALVGNKEVEAKISNPQNAIFDLPAVLVTIFITWILVKGISESAFFNAIMVVIKVAAVLFVILVGMWYINPANYTPFAPKGWTGISFFGIPLHGETNSGGEPVGMLAGAAIIFFAYIGFDAVSTQAEEAKNPKRDIPIGIISSLVVCTILYIAVVAVLTGMVKFSEIDKKAGVADAFLRVGMPWAEWIISAAGVAGITSVLLVMMMSAPRVFLAMARDGLLPKKFFADVHPKFQTPWKSTICVGVLVALMAGFLPIDALLHLTNIGTLLAFVIVCVAVLVMRRTNPNAERPFKCPLVPVVPILGIVLCSVMMLSLPAENWYRLLGWLAIGFVIYFLYGKQHSNLGKAMRGEKVT